MIWFAAAGLLGVVAFIVLADAYAKGRLDGDTDGVARGIADDEETWRGWSA